MKKHLLTLIACLMAAYSFAGNLLEESFEYGNHDLEKPAGWTCDDLSWRCGYLEKDHNRKPHSGNWYAFTDSEEAWMFMPVYLIPSMRFNFSMWAVADGSYTLSFWTGATPNPEAMTLQIFSENVDETQYKQITAHIEDIPEGCEYIGICGTQLQNGAFLTIDDIEIDMVKQYEFMAMPITGDTAMYPGTQGQFRFMVRNIGYDPLNITANPYNTYFTGFSCQCNGNTGMTFHVEPSEIVEVTMTAQLRPEIEPGTVVWLDIPMSIPGSCNTAMVTFWVTPLDLTQIAENDLEISVFPNPTTSMVTIAAKDLQHITLYDMAGRAVLNAPADGERTCIDVSVLKSGYYIISAKTRSTSSFVKPILKM